VSLVSVRDKYLHDIDTTDFPEEITLERESGGTGKVRFTCSREHGLNDYDTVVIEGSDDYNGSFVVYNVSLYTFSIEAVYSAGIETGVIAGSGYKFTDSIDEVTRFPAVLLTIDRTLFRTSNGGTLESFHKYNLSVIDLLSNYEASTEAKQIALAEHNIWESAIKILSTNPARMRTDIDEETGLQVFEAYSDSKEEVVVAYTEIFIAE